MKNSTRSVLLSFYQSAALKVLAGGHWVATAITLIVSLLILILLQNSAADVRILQLDRSNLLSVMGSIFASAIFFILTEFIFRIRAVRNTAEKDFFDKVFVEFGMRGLYDQRGDQAALADYQKLLSLAKERIWAIGITNHRFTTQHTPVLVERLRSCPTIDIRVAFMDPDATVYLRGDASLPPETLPQLHNKIERGINSSGPMIGEIEEYISRVVNAANTISGSGGRLRIYKLITPCYFTCFIIDDSVFFFPMLARQESGQDPTIRVDKGGVLGQAIFAHFEKVLMPGPYARVVYDNQAPAPSSGSTPSVDGVQSA